MRRLTTRLAAGALCLLLLAAAHSAAANDEVFEVSERGEPSLYEKAFDATLARPLGLVPIVVSGVGCVMGLPITLFMDDPVEYERICWRDPFDYTFSRPLGEF